MAKATGRGTEDNWVVNCPACETEIEYRGYFDPEEPCECDKCGEEFITTELRLDNGDIIK
jgi:uncharacterized protein (DUF983 family)